MARERVRRLSAGQRLQRLLSVVPWIAARDGPRIDEVCARFGCDEIELVEDLQLLFLCGLPPYTPDVLIDVDITDGRVWIRYADYFSRPLRLTPAEGLALLAAAEAVLAAPDADPGGPLARGVRKLAEVLGVEAGETVEVKLAPAPAEVVEVLRQAVSDRRQVELDYYAFGRDEWTCRTVDPYEVFSAGGQWYLSAHCHGVDDQRLFRVDRVRRATLLDRRFRAPAPLPEPAVYRPRPDDPRVTLELAPAARWVVEQYPVEHVEEGAGGGLRVTLVASERAWLERLLLRLGPHARVVEGDPDVGRGAAERLLRRYRRRAAATDPGPRGGARPR